jgi:hypothetical protein
VKLTRIRIEQFRQFRQPLQIGELDSGLNLFTGPNEVGKSTVVAAIRAAFFERHRSGSVDDLRPWGDASASPTVELEFETGGVAYRLGKSFLGRKRCTLTSGTQQFDGADAEDRLAELLGFRHAGRGASAAEYWGIPGLLWIQQGTAHNIRDPVAHATDHLRTALNTSLGEVASSGGDAVTDEVEALRNELLTPANATPRGPYREALETEAVVASELAALDADIAAYGSKVDRLAVLRGEHEADDAQKPWLALRAQEQAARRKFDEARALGARLGEAQQRARRIGDTLVLLHSQLERYGLEQREVEQRRTALTVAEGKLTGVQATVQPWQRRSTEAAARHDAARHTLNRARQRDTRLTLSRQLDELTRRRDVACASLAQADFEAGRLRAARQQMAATELRSADLATLRAQQLDIRALRLRQEAAATRLHFMLDDGRVIRIGEESLTGQGERLLTDATVVTLPGLGRLDITPGGADLADLGRQEAALLDRHAALLARLGAESLDAAEARLQQHVRHQADAQAAEAALKARAPQGLDALRGELAVLEGRLTEAVQSLERLAGEPDDGSALPSINEAESQEEAARASAADAAKQLAATDIAAASAQSAVDAARLELRSAQAILDAPERAARLAVAQRALNEALAGQVAADVDIEALSAQCRDARPDILEQDIRRFGGSAEQLERTASLRRDELTRLEVELHTAGAQGLDERRAERARDHARAVRRTTELRRRASALDHLLTLLKTHRSALTRRLQAPLQKHLDRYLQLLFPHANLDIDDQLVPGALTRAGVSGAESGGFEEFSFGAREQMGVISRLAYADLLREAGRPTLIILDDALVHSDDERLARMKRVLFDAATRHQILMFTCHPDNWRDLGAAARSLEALKAV